MATWSSRGLRGSVFEDMINRTNEKYKENHLALIQKIPTPITPIKMDKETRHITLAYFNQKSTVDYIGVVQGIPVCFDAKECADSRFSLQNIHPHQVEFMRQFEEQEGIAFFLISYTKENIYYYLPMRELGAGPGRRTKKLPVRRAGQDMDPAGKGGHTGPLSGNAQ